jgi:hypothetical protein
MLQGFKGSRIRGFKGKFKNNKNLFEEEPE